MSDLISIIVPVYNVEAYLCKCIDSILAQTYQNFELILVDDGSPDNCPQICDEYAKNDKRIHVIHQANGGLSAARNAGFDISNGEYVTFIDSDDWVEAGYLAIMHDAIKKYDMDFVQCNFRYVGDANGLEPLSRQMDDEVIMTRDDAIDALFIYKGMEGLNTMAWGKLYRRAIFDAVKFPVGRIHEDDFALCDIVTGLQHGCVSLKRIGYNYYQRDDGLNRHLNPKKMVDRFESWIYVLEHIPANHQLARQCQCGYLFKEITDFLSGDCCRFMEYESLMSECPEFATVLRRAIRFVPCRYLYTCHEKLLSQHLNWKDVLLWWTMRKNLKLGLWLYKRKKR